jgi:hypothetical protein
VLLSEHPPLSSPTPAKTNRHLTSRAVDFWLLGGASIVLWGFMIVLEGEGREAWVFDHHFMNLLALSGSLALVGNYPHFMASYRLAYSQGAGFIFRNWFQLIAVPIGLIGSIAASYLLFETTSSEGAFVQLNQALRAIGLDTQVGLSPTTGQEIISLLIQFMFFTVGWHYAKQTYGCMRVMANFDGYALTAPQWKLLKATLFSVWFCSFAWANIGHEQREMQGLGYVTLGLPDWFNTIALISFIYLLSASVLMLRDVRARTGQRPSANMLVAPIAFILWWFPPLVQLEFYIWIVPFFHSIQYLGFVYKIESSQLMAEHPDSTSLRGGIIALALVLAGFAAFELIPNTVDNAMNTNGQMGVWFFFAAAAIFINVHHYFIDNVIWRFQNARIRTHLLS